MDAVGDLETEVVVDDVEKPVAVVDPEPAVYVAPSAEPSDYVEAEEPAEPEPIWTPEPPVLPPPPAPKKPSESPSWLGSWMKELSTTPTPDLPKPTVQVAEVDPKPAYGIQTSYTRKWGKSSYTKPVVKEYNVPTYKPIVYTPKAYTPKVVSYTRPEPKVEETPAETKPEETKPTVKTEKRTYSSYDSDDTRYLRTYRSKYSGTPKKPHSHMSCLQRMLSRFSKYNSIVRKRRQTRNSSLSQRN